MDFYATLKQYRTKRTPLYLVSTGATLSVVEEAAADPAQLLCPDEVDRSIVSRSRFVVRVFLYLRTNFKLCLQHSVRSLSQLSLIQGDPGGVRINWVDIDF